MKKLMTIVVLAPLLVLTAGGGEEARGSSSEIPTVDHYKCYSAKTKPGTPRFEPQEVLLADQFETKVTKVLRSDFVCTPVSKDGSEIIDPETHLKCYFIKEALPLFEPQDVAVQDQLGNEIVTLFKPQLLCVPAKKTLLACGGGLTCPSDRVCDRTDETCAIPDPPGMCVPRGVCVQVFDPVCGCDGVTYPNDCERVQAGAILAHRGECGPFP